MTKILYSLQATGNGHISRAMVLLPYLQKYGEVDLMLSGDNSTLALDAPVKFRSKGLSLYYTCVGNLNHLKLARSFSPMRMLREIRELPVHEYDIVINDFDCITSLACAFSKKNSIHFGHQASFLSDAVPRPEKRSRIGEWVLHHYAKGTTQLGLHFSEYDSFIVNPVIKDEILHADPKDNGHITVYLPSYCEKQLIALFRNLTDQRFEIFSRQTKQEWRLGNITMLPVSNSGFNSSLINCHGIITGAGFETPAEALYLRKKMIAIPIHGQYEQQCNAAALAKLGVITCNRLDENFPALFEKWICSTNTPSLNLKYSNSEIAEIAMEKASAGNFQVDAA